MRKPAFLLNKSRGNANTKPNYWHSSEKRKKRDASNSSSGQREPQLELLRLANARMSKISSEKIRSKRL